MQINSPGQQQVMSPLGGILNKENSQSAANPGQKPTLQIRPQMNAPTNPFTLVAGQHSSSNNPLSPGLNQKGAKSRKLKQNQDQNILPKGLDDPNYQWILLKVLKRHNFVNGFNSEQNALKKYQHSMISKPDMKKDQIPNLYNPDTKDLRESEEKIPDDLFQELIETADNEDEEEDETTKDQRFQSLKKVLHIRYKKMTKGEGDEDNCRLDDKSKIEDLNEEIDAEEQNEFQEDGEDVSESSETKVPPTRLGKVIRKIKSFFENDSVDIINKLDQKRSDVSGSEYSEDEEDVSENEEDENGEDKGPEQREFDSPEDRKEYFIKVYRRKYCKKSLNTFSVEDNVRYLSIRFIEWKWFDRFIIFLIALNSLFLGSIDYVWDPEDDKTGKPWINRYVDASEPAFTFFFSLEAAVKILSMGLIFEKGCYLRDGWNWLDFTVVITALLQNIPGMGNVSAIRTFRLFRPLRSLSAVPSMKMLVNTLLLSVSQLSNILILDTFFIMTFAIFGLQMWEGVIHYRCRQTKYPVDGDWKVVEDDERICGAFHSCEVTCGSLYELDLPDETGVKKMHYLNMTIVQDLNRDSKSAAFNYGITNFDGIASSFLTIFQCTTLEGWSDIMNMIQDGYNVYTSAIFFIICVIICAYFLLNLTVAVMLDQFKGLNKENIERQNRKYEKNQKRVQQLKDIEQIMDMRKKFSLKQHLKLLWEKVVYLDPGTPPQSRNPSRHDYLICTVCWKVIHIPFFNTFIMLLIILNTLILATDQYPSPEFDIISYTNQAFTYLFTIECIVKLTGLKFHEWKKDKFNIFDLIIVFASLIELLVAPESAGIVSALRAFRLIRLFKLARSNITLRCLLDSIAYTIAAIGNFMVLLAIFIYVFALLGMEMFAGKFRFDREGNYNPIEGQVPRQNFDSLTWALVTVFQILVGDKWNEVMYKAYLSVSPSTVSYFFILVLLGKIIMLNLFLAILLGNFEQASLMIRSQMEDKVLKQFEQQKKKMKKHSKDDVNAESIPDLVNRETGQPSLSAQVQHEMAISPLTDFSRQMSQPDQFQIKPMKVEGSKEDQYYSEEFLLTNDGRQGHNENINPFTQEIGSVRGGTGQFNPHNHGQQCKSFKDSSYDSSIALELNSQDLPEDDFIQSPIKQIGDISNKVVGHGNRVHPAQFANAQVDQLQVEPPRRSSLFKKSMTQQEIIESEEESHNTLEGSARNRNKIVKSIENDFQGDDRSLRLMKKKLEVDDADKALSDNPFAKPQNEQIEPMNSERNMETNRNLIEEGHQIEEVAGSEPKQSNVQDRLQNELNVETNLNGSFNQENDNQIKLEDEENKQDGQEATVEDSANNTLNSSFRHTIQAKVLKYIGESSLLIFHRDSFIRKFMIQLTTAPIQKTVTQKDILLSQIQNGGVQDDDSEDENEEEDVQQEQNQANQELALDQQKSANIQNPTGENTDILSPETVGTPYNIGGNQVLPIGIADIEEPPVRVVPKKKSRRQKLNDDKEKEGQTNATPDRLQLLQEIVSKNEMHNYSTLYAIQELEIMMKQQPFKNILKSKGTKQIAFRCLKQKRKFACCQWSLNQWFEYMIYLFIMLSMVMLIVDNPMNDPKSDFAKYIEQIDRSITLLFAVEALFRIIALGFFQSSIPQRKGYIKSGSNQIDFFVCIGCDLILLYNGNRDEATLNQQTLKSFKVLRSVRALRPLRVISKNQGLKLAVGSLFGALPAIANGMIVCCLIVFIYAILGVSFFKGQFYRCIFPGIEEDDPLYKTIVTKQDCIDAEGLWINRSRNFDTTLNALGVLFEIITTEGWLDVMYHGVDSKGLDLQPDLNWRPIMSLYFISFIIVGNIFILNLFVGIVIDKFNRLKDKMCGYSLMTSHQIEWVESEKQMIRLDLKRKKNPPINPNQLIAYNIQSHPRFEHFITFCIFSSTTIMALKYYKMSHEYQHNLEILSRILTVIYNLEAIVKIIALQKDYFESNWNRFDMSIVIVADLSFVVEQFTKDGDESTVVTMLSIIKAVRIMRVFRLIRVSKNLRVLVDSLIVILPSIANVGSLIILMFFIFSVIGMNMFATVILQEELNDNSNFTSFGMSFVLLLQCATGEKWNIIMKELSIQNTQTLFYNEHDKLKDPDYAMYIQLRKYSNTIECLDVQPYDSLIQNGYINPMECGTSLSYAYFALFIVVIQMMMLNLFIAVVLEGFSSTNKEHTGSVTSEHFNDLIDKWIHYDQEATGWIDVRDLIFLIYELSEPLGRFTEYDQDIKDQFLQQDAAFGQKNMMNGVVEQGMRFVVSMDREMIVPFLRALPLLQEMALPVYSDFQDHTRQYKCHFRDVCKKLTRIALTKKNPNYDDGGIEPKHKKILSRAWVEKYTDIKHKKVLKGYHTGQLWAGLFIVSCVRNVCNMRKQKKMRVGIQEKRLNFQPKQPKKKEENEEGHGSCSHDNSELQSENKTVQNQPVEACAHAPVAFSKHRSPATKFRHKMGLKGQYLSSYDLQLQKQEELERIKKSYGPQQQKNKSSKKRSSQKPKKKDDEFELSMETIRQIKQKAKEEQLKEEDLEFLLHIQRWKKKTEMTKQMIANKVNPKKTEKNDQVDVQESSRQVENRKANLLIKQPCWNSSPKKSNMTVNNDERMIFMEEDYDPKYKKDIDRSTWWMNNRRLNYKMSNWVKHQDSKKDVLKKDKMYLDVADIPVQKTKSHMVPRSKMSESSFRTHQ